MLNSIFALVLVVLLFMLLLYVTHHWNIHGTDYQHKTHIRKALFNMPIAKPFISRKDYSKDVWQSGWNASISLPVFGVLCFVERTKDGADGDFVFAW